MASLRITCPGCSARLRIRSDKAAGRKIRCPKCKTDFVAAVAEASPSPEKSASRPKGTLQTGGNISEETVAPVIHTDESQSVASRVRKRRSSKIPVVLMALAVIGVVGAAVWWMLASTQKLPARSQRQTATQSVTDTVVAEVAAVECTPADVDPISLECIPVVPQLLLHIHPAKLWSVTEPYRQFTGTLGNAGTWLRRFIEESTRFDVSEIAALTIAVNFGSRGSQPDVAMVVRTVDEHPESQLLQKHIQGTMVPDLNGEVVEAGGFGWMIVDSNTVALATLELAEDLADSRQFPAVPSAKMESMLKVSNQNHLVTLFADLRAMDTHKDLILVEQLHQIAELSMLWFLPDTVTVGWSMQLEPHLKMETRLAPTAESTAVGLQRRMQAQLKTLPQQLVSLAGSLKPRTIGHAKIIGRFPAMLEALQMGTQVSVDSGMTVMKTMLPQMAAANLAAGATLTWNETLIQASPGRPEVAETPTRAIVPLAEQLQREVLVDFRRAPLHEAIEYLGQSLDIPLKIDGDALMLAGFTQNMPQTHDLGTVTILQALNAILAPYEGMMVITHDTEQAWLLLTTDAAVGDRKILKTD